MDEKLKNELIRIINLEGNYKLAKIERAFRDAGWQPPGQSFPLTRKQFLALPMEVRREILAKQAERVVSEHR